MANEINTESILNQFDIVDTSLHRARLPFDTNMLQGEVLEVTLYELIKSYRQIENMIREIAPERFGKQRSYVVCTPEISMQSVRICRICGELECTSDHK